MADREDPVAWIGREQTRSDEIGTERARAMAATLDLVDLDLTEGSPLPSLWHWLYFWDVAPRSRLGRDGHPELGGFLPDLGDVRRMWAGSRVTFHQPLRVGDTATKTSRITDVTEKEGRSGHLVFVTVRHEVAGSDGVAITDEQSLVYREMSGPGRKPSEAPPDGAEFEGANHVEHWNADPTLLFRYSALTFNGHRIHYDAPYAADVEGYPGLVVHGPLVATLMAGAAERHQGAPLSHFAFRGLSPMIVDESISIHVAQDAPGARLWVRGGNGRLITRGEAAW